MSARRRPTLAEDGLVNGMLRGSASLFAGEWAARTGVRAPQMTLTPEWSRGLRADLIREVNSRPELEYVFRHILVRASAYGSLLHRQRRQLQQAAGVAQEIAGWC